MQVSHVTTNSYGILTRMSIGAVRLYQMILSPYLGGQCRYYPSCSHYSIQAFRKHGFLRGFVMTVWRILRCNPFSKGGIDIP